ncbi:MAG: MoaD/ThiS family protein [Rhodospirillales bacterium]|nr:MoaD/ThiS family protein [Rhodospirillales bacterium]
MKVKVKLFALLEKYLPAGAKDYQVELELDDGATAAAVIANLGVPPELCHLILINGKHMQLAERDSRPLTSTDTIAIWPPIAGG